jgi:predicted GNAT superfamily acetyltransferase
MGSPIVNAIEHGGEPVLDLVDAGTVRVEVPREIHEVKRRSMELARAWRSASRRAFLHYMVHGYRVLGFQLEPTSRRCFYILGEE